MDAAIDLYYFPASPPSRAVMLLARAIGLVLNLKMVNIMAGEQLRPEYLKMNPMHTVPTMDDNGFILWESRAIMEYLIDQYGKDSGLMPKDPKAKGVVNQRLYFEATTLFPRIVDHFFPIVSQGAAPSTEKMAKVEEALQVIEMFLENNKYVAGDRMTVADISFVATVSTAEAVGFKISDFPRVKDWYALCKKDMAPFGYEEINQKGADMIAAQYKLKTHQ